MFPSPARYRRVRAAAIKAVVGVVLLVLVGLFLYSELGSERIRSYRVDVVVREDGSALIRETIDYDFAAKARHGIYRTIPVEDDVEVTDVRARSGSAPAVTSVTERPGETEIRLGDPSRTVRGLHRYVLEYRLSHAIADDKLALDAIGSQWTVPIEEATVRLRAPYQLEKVRCEQGVGLSTARCDGLRVGNDRVVVHAAGLEREGVTIHARVGKPTNGAPSALPSDVELTAGDSWWWLHQIAMILAVGTVGYVAGLVAATRWVRRAGQDRAWHGEGGPVDAVFGGPELPDRGIDDVTADQQTTIQFVPPAGLTAPQGGVLLHEEIRDEHRVAWLAQQVVDGWIEIDKYAKTLSWGSRAAADRAAAPKPLRAIFSGRDEVSLERYDAGFAIGWDGIERELDEWMHDCELWDFEAERRARTFAAKVDTVAVLAAMLGGVGLWLTIGWNVWFAVGIAAVASLLVGAGVAVFLNSAELSVRTPQGFAKRQLVEGFRRFFEQSEARHARQAADRGELRLYSAWAVALGALELWEGAIEAAALPSNIPGLTDSLTFGNLGTSVWTGITPSGPLGVSGGGGVASGGRGGGGAGVGGGVGGGGGGSW